MDELRFLSVEDVLALHDDTLAHEGGLIGVRDVGLLESAVAMPQQQFGGFYLHDGMAAQASAYLFHIAPNHPFLDGNKRAAALAALVFLDVNGVEKLPDPAALQDATLSVASGQMSKDELTDWMRGAIGEPISPEPTE